MDAIRQNDFLSLKKIILILLFLFLIPMKNIFADAPYITDDPAVMDPWNWDVILYATVDKYKSFTALQAPALELDFAFIPNSEIDIYLPYQNNINARPAYRSGIPNSSGVGDTDVEIKYRLLKESKYLPLISLVPNIYFPTGDINQGLGNGHIWYTLPLSIEKTFGTWTTYAELGYGLNSQYFAVNYLFGGFVVEKTLNDKITVGGEVYSQGKSSIFLSSSTLLNFGVTYKLDKHATLLFSLGRGIIGQEQWASYLGISWG